MCPARLIRDRRGIVLVPAVTVTPGAVVASPIPIEQPPNLEPGVPILGADATNGALAVLTPSSVLLRTGAQWRTLSTSERVRPEAHIRIGPAHAFIGVDSGEFTYGGLTSFDLTTGNTSLEVAWSVTALTPVRDSCVVAAGWSYAASRGEIFMVCAKSQHAEASLTTIGAISERVSDLAVRQSGTFALASSSGLSHLSKGRVFAVAELETRSLCGFKLSRYADGSRVVALQTVGWSSAVIVDEAE